MIAQRQGEDGSDLATFGQQVKRLRTEAGLTQQQLADRVGVSVSAVRDWEARGAKEQEADLYRRLARALGVSTDVLLGMSEGT